jgi:hypothetical protein
MNILWITCLRIILSIPKSPSARWALSSYPRLMPITDGSGLLLFIAAEPIGLYVWACLHLHAKRRKLRRSSNAAIGAIS